MLKLLTDKISSLLSSGQPKQQKPAPQVTKRKGDHIMVVSQRNDLKKIEINAVDKELQKLTGYTAEHLTRIPLNEILPETVNDSIKNYLEYDGGNDLSVVLGKVRDFAIIANGGKKIPLSLRIFATTSKDSNPSFCLIMREAGLKKEISAARQRLADEMANNIELDEVSGLPVKEVFVKNLELVIKFIEQRGINATVALISIDKFFEIDEKFGKDFGNLIIQTLGSYSKTCFREDDIAAYFGGNQIGVILIDSDSDSAIIPLNRFRSMVESRAIENEQGKALVKVTIAHYTILGKDSVFGILDTCEKGIEKAREQNSRLIHVS